MNRFALASRIYPDLTPLMHALADFEAKENRERLARYERYMIENGYPYTPMRGERPPGKITVTLKADAGGFQESLAKAASALRNPQQ